MMDYQIHFGRRFYKDKKTGYWISSDYPRIRAHRWVWICNHGKIPKGFHIHHKNQNKSDNSLQNLQLIECSVHMALHYTEERRIESRKLMEHIRPLTKEWHKSEEGRAWHRLHAIKSKLGKWDPREYSCHVCKKSYYTTKRGGTKFCSNRCKSKFRRSSGVDNIISLCSFCKKEFSMSKYSKTLFCSRSCAQRGRLIK